MARRTCAVVAASRSTAGAGLLPGRDQRLGFVRFAQRHPGPDDACRQRRRLDVCLAQRVEGRERTRGLVERPDAVGVDGAAAEQAQQRGRSQPFVFDIVVPERFIEPSAEQSGDGANCGLPTVACSQCSRIRAWPARGSGQSTGDEPAEVAGARLLRHLELARAQLRAELGPGQDEVGEGRQSRVSPLLAGKRELPYLIDRGERPRRLVRACVEERLDRRERGSHSLVIAGCRQRPGPCAR